MTVTEMISFANDLLDEEGRLSDSLGVLLANHIKDLIEAERNWNFLLKRDVSISITSATTFETENDLPSDFTYEKRIGILDSNNNFQEVKPVNYVFKETYRDTNSYCIDEANQKIYFLGTFSESYTAVIYYFYKTDDLAAATEPVWNERFHKIIPFLMAEIHGSGIDYDSIEMSKAIAQSKQGGLLYNSMKAMDNKINLKSINGSTPIVGEPEYMNRINF